MFPRTGAVRLENLTQVLHRLEEARVSLKREKCAYLLPAVAYLGHVISADGLHTFEEKVRGIVEASAP